MEGPTIHDWGNRRAVMETLPAMESYEDMFKEITRKLYGEDNLADGDTDHGSIRGGDCDGEGPDGHGALAAFGLAALMQNGFPPPPGMFAHHHHIAEAGRTRSGDDKWIVSEENLPWTSSKIASYNSSQRLFRCTECDCVGFLSRIVEHWLGTHANLRVFQCPTCPYSSAWARCVRMHLQRQHNVADSPEAMAGLWKENPVLDEVTKYLQRLKGRVESPPPPPVPAQKTEYSATTHQNHSPPNRQPSQASGTENTPNKRYCCTFCPYATDRRDLFTRHENIHRDEKPFHCYVCQKQFNRADHVKKHFLRMHRDHPYDLNRIRRPLNKSGNGYYDNKYPQQTPQRQQTLTPQGQIHPGLNIPAGFAPPSAVRQLKQFGSPNKVVTGCNAKSHGSKSGKKKGEKRYSCCYCTWSGVDNWCLKRHLNTHLKPFVCALCDYKAARAERLATHVLKVHNKRSCGRCSFLAEDSAQLAIHIQDHHPADGRIPPTNRPPPPPHILRNANLPNGHANPSAPAPYYHDGTPAHVRRPHDDPSGLWAPHGHIPSGYPLNDESWKSNKHFGAARLFHYMEASDNSEPELEPEEEPPPFICRECGCEFVDDTSLETHVFMHHRTTKLEDLKPPAKYDKYSIAQKSKEPWSKRSRKLENHRRAPVAEGEVQVVRAREGPRRLARFLQQLREKYIAQQLTRKHTHCLYCPRPASGLPYHSKVSVALHQLWRHREDQFSCEQCSQTFRHRYQAILHSSREHVPAKSKENNNNMLNEMCPSPAPTLLDLQPFRSTVAFPTARALHEFHTSRHYFAGMDEARQSDLCTTYKILPLPGTSAPAYNEPSTVPLVVPIFPQTV